MIALQTRRDVNVYSNWANRMIILMVRRIDRCSEGFGSHWSIPEIMNDQTLVLGVVHSCMNQLAGKGV